VHLRTIEALEAERITEPERQQRRALAATSAVRIASGKESEDVVLKPLPQRPTQAQRLGIEVHAWIEELHRGLIGLAEEDALDEASVPPDRETVTKLKARFVALGYEGRAPFELPGGEPATEVPFTLKLADDLVVRGRIDAVYPTDEGPLEIVDFKTGAVPDEPDWGQLELYAEALAALGLVDGGEVILTFAYLQADEPVPSRRYTPRGLDWLRTGLAAAPA
jgi:DNA helicase II / ATP-dependent DNA helicase PcrA